MPWRKCSFRGQAAYILCDRVYHVASFPDYADTKLYHDGESSSGDTFLALVIPFAVSAFAILMFRQAFQGLPQALIDAAALDGCNELRIIFTRALAKYKTHACHGGDPYIYWFLE